MDFFPLYLSAKLAVITTSVLILISAPLAYFLVYVKWPGKFLFEALLNLPSSIQIVS